MAGLKNKSAMCEIKVAFFNSGGGGNIILVLEIISNFSKKIRLFSRFVVRKGIGPLEMRYYNMVEYVRESLEVQNIRSSELKSGFQLGESQMDRIGDDWQ